MISSCPLLLGGMLSKTPNFTKPEDPKHPGISRDALNRVVMLAAAEGVPDDGLEPAARFDLQVLPTRTRGRIGTEQPVQ